jgi:antirestriction protein ArdC
VKKAIQAEHPITTLYAEVTDRIIAELEAGRLPWVQPWGDTGAEVGMPCNAGTGRRYSGINVLILWATVIERGYASQRWLTYRQAQALGGNVRKGEAGVTVCYADRFTPKDQGGGDGQGEEQRQVAFLKRFTVFNVDQCEGLGADLVGSPIVLTEEQIVPVADALIAASGVGFRVCGLEAFYMPAQDVVMVPPRRAYFDQINAYRTWLHELVHATGHASRLGRDLSNPFGSSGSSGYAREELIAEMGSAFLCASLGIVPTVRHADYIGAWLEVLKEDDRAIFRAASAASKAADWLLDRHAKACSDALLEEAA